jgi:hypothetical protein
MALHLIKLSVGTESVEQLAQWQDARRRDGSALMHITRNTPKRAEELLSGGSIYWVIKGMLCARQPLLELRPVTVEGVPHCAIVHAAEMIPVSPRPHRAFQGWRYLQAKDAPPDLTQAGTDDMPEAMRNELARLGLL